MGTLMFSLESGRNIPNRDWASFLEVRQEWIADRYTGDELIYCLHPPQIHECLKLFQIHSDAFAAEREFTELCDRHNAIGVSHGRFLHYPLLRPLLEWPANVDLKPFLELGWTKADIACVVNLEDPTAKINRRLRAATGRLISSPRFAVDVTLSGRLSPRHRS
jgi:hypothetical protein